MQLVVFRQIDDVEILTIVNKTNSSLVNDQETNQDEEYLNEWSPVFLLNFSWHQFFN